MVGFLIIHICETFVKHETKISGWLEPLIHTIKVNDQFLEDIFTKVTSPLPHNQIL